MAVSNVRTPVTQPSFFTGIANGCSKAAAKISNLAKSIFEGIRNGGCRFFSTIRANKLATAGVIFAVLVVGGALYLYRNPLSNTSNPPKIDSIDDDAQSDLEDDTHEIDGHHDETTSINSEHSDHDDPGFTLEDE